jgi:sec-independent protein translocase protein TatC
MANEQPSLTFTEHLEELRRRLIICAVALLVCTAIGFLLARPVLSILIRPLSRVSYKQNEKVLHLTVSEDGVLRTQEPLTAEDIKQLSKLRIEFDFPELNDTKFVFGPDYRSHFYYFHPVDPFVLTIKAALMTGILLALPIWLWQVWLFVSPALTNKERRYIISLLGLALILFPVGAGFAYYSLKFALGFLNRYTIPGLEPRLDILKYISFALTMMIAAGCVFEVPLVILFLTRIGVISTKTLRKYRAAAIVLIFVLAAAFTPPDPLTMIAMAIPIILLYELSIWIARPLERKKQFANESADSP